MQKEGEEELQNGWEGGKEEEREGLKEGDGGQ